MIKKILFITAIFGAGIVSAQTFQILDHFDNDITGTNHTEYGSGQSLDGSKFHVKNISGNGAIYGCEVQEITNVPVTDLQVCYGPACYSATAGVPTVYTIPGVSLSLAGGAIDSTFKVAPFSGFGAWTGGESATWRVKIFNTTNPNDSASVVITFQAYGVGVEEITANNVALNTYPNPATDIISVNYSIDGNVNNAKLNVYDIVGKKVKSYVLTNNKDQLSINVSDLNSGVYFYSIMVDGKAIKTERVIVK